MEIVFDNYSIAPIHAKDAWRLCDLMVSNSDRFKDYFPGTLKENLNPTLSELFVSKKVKEFNNKEEYLFTVKENTDRTIIGLVYLKELQKKEGQGELAYCFKSFWQLALLGIKNPFFIYPTFTATKQCLKISTEHYGRSHYQNTPANAFRHAFWNYLIAIKCTKWSKNSNRV